MRALPVPRNGACPRPTTVLYIAGSARSGTTLVARAVGELPNFFAAGELTFVWTRGVLDNQLCGCGRHFLDCPFWRTVGESAFGGWFSADPQRMATLQRSIDRTRYIPLLSRPSISTAFQGRLDEFTDVLASLYTAIRGVSGCDFIVDSSKRISYAAAVRSARGLDIRLLHVLRDSRGVAYSSSKHVRRPEITDRSVYMPSVPAARFAGRWLTDNVLLELMAKFGRQAYQLLTYERFVQDPMQALRNIARFCDAAPLDSDTNFVSEAKLTLSESHSISGNPMRFERGAVSLLLDEAWRSQLGTRDRALVTMLTMPGLIRYGYLRPREGSAWQTR